MKCVRSRYVCRRHVEFANELRNTGESSIIVCSTELEAYKPQTILTSVQRCTLRSGFSKHLKKILEERNCYAIVQGDDRFIQQTVVNYVNYKLPGKCGKQQCKYLHLSWVLKEGTFQTIRQQFKTVMIVRLPRQIFKTKYLIYI